MQTVITSNEVKEFLEDYSKNSEIMVLDEGQEKNELIESAKKRGIIVSKDDIDLGVLKTIYCFTDVPNDNNCIVPSKEFVKVFPKIIGRPMNIGHLRQKIVGFYIDYKYVAKENKAITYAIFFKSSYPEEWEHAKELQKQNKLSSSFELWSPLEKRKYNSDGTYELHDITPAGGALIFEENGEAPAFKDAKVLSVAKNKFTECIDKKYLAYASKYKDNEIITSSTVAEVVQTTIKIKCSNCTEEFESGEIANIKCPKCFALLNKEGTMLYPPQIKDFKMLCPSCKVDNWLIMSKKEDVTKVKCMGCSKEYNLTAEKRKNNELVDRMNFVYVGSASCYQCHSSIDFSGVSNVKTRTLKCKKCGLEFSHDISKERYRRISKITEVIKKEVAKVEEMKKEEAKVEEAVEKVNAEPVQAKTESEQPEVAKAEETKEETPIEAKAEAKEETAQEEKPVEAKTEKKPEEAKAEETPEAVQEEKPVEAKVEEKPEEAKEQSEENKSEEKPEEASQEEKVEDKPEEAKTEETKEEQPEEAKKEEPTELDKATTKIEELKAGIKKVAKQVIDLKKQVELYRENAKEIIKRQGELGEFGKDLSEEDILNNDKFEKAKLEKENAVLKAKLEKSSVSTKVGDKAKDDAYFSNIRKEVDKRAFKQ